MAMIAETPRVFESIHQHGYAHSDLHFDIIARLTDRIRMRRRRNETRKRRTAPARKTRRGR